MSNSSLISYTKISPNKTSPRNHKIDTITIHCFVGQVTAKQGANAKHFVNYDPKNGASCNYVVGKDGDISLVVEEKDRSWCSSNRANDNRAITIEVASDTKAPYAITGRAMVGLIELCADICKRNGIKKLIWSNDKNARINHLNGCNMTCHRDYASKSCPGDYIYSREEQIAQEVNRLLGVNESTTDIEYPVYTKDTKEKFIEDVAKYVNIYKDKYGIEVSSPIIAQACLESGYGTSELAVQAQNYFGLKYNMQVSTGKPYTKLGTEQNKDGSYSSSTMTWCSFNNLAESVEGYFKFLFERTGVKRYDKLKGVTDPRKYLELIKEAGYATSLNYVDNVMRVVDSWNLTKYDNAKSKAVYYTIVSGDSLNKIAAKYGTTAKEIQSLNSDLIKNINLIRVGWKIRVK